jgi:hypothetical protein
MTPPHVRSILIDRPWQSECRNVLVTRSPVLLQTDVERSDSYVNYMLVFIPISWALHFTHQNSVIVFIFSMFAVVPLAALLGFA